MFWKGMSSGDSSHPTATRSVRTGWRNIKLGELSPGEQRLVRSVIAADDVLVGRSANISGRGMMTLDAWLDDNGINWTQRWQDVYDKALYERTSIGKPVQVLSGWEFAAEEAAAAEAGARVGGIRNIPFWPRR
jgi:hypothetical protein